MSEQLIPERIKLETFQPMRNLLLISIYEPGIEMINGVMLPGTSDPDFLRAKVIKAGPGSRTMSGDLIPPAVKEGDDVLIPGNLRNSLRKLTIENEDYLLIEEGSVLAAV